MKSEGTHRLELKAQQLEWVARREEQALHVLGRKLTNHNGLVRGEEARFGIVKQKLLSATAKKKIDPTLQLQTKLLAQKLAGSKARIKALKQGVIGLTNQKQIRLNSYLMLRTKLDIVRGSIAGTKKRERIQAESLLNEDQAELFSVKKQLALDSNLHLSSDSQRLADNSFNNILPLTKDSAAQSLELKQALQLSVAEDAAPQPYTDFDKSMSNIEKWESCKPDELVLSYETTSGEAYIVGVEGAKDSLSVSVHANDNGSKAEHDKKELKIKEELESHGFTLSKIKMGKIQQNNEGEINGLE